MKLELTVTEDSKRIISRIIVSGDNVKEVMFSLYSEYVSACKKDEVLAISEFLLQVNSFMNFIRDGKAKLVDDKFVALPMLGLNTYSRVLERLYVDTVDAIHCLSQHNIDVRRELNEFVKFD